MARKDLDQWAQRFSIDLGVGVGRAPFDRIVRHHHADIQRLLDAHMTFVTLAAALTRAGAVRADGRPYSADQLYVAVKRAESLPKRQRTRASAPDKVGSGNAEDRLRQIPHRNGSSGDPAAKDFAAKPHSEASAPRESIGRFEFTHTQNVESRDLTDEDVSAALRRIRKSD